MKYTTKIEKGTFDRQIGELKNGHLVSNKHERINIDVLDVKMQTKLENKEDVKKLAELLYPELVATLGENQYIGVRIMLERTIKLIFSKDKSLNDFQRDMLRQYTAMKLDIDIFDLRKQNH